MTAYFECTKIIIVIIYSGNDSYDDDGKSFLVLLENWKHASKSKTVIMTII